MYTCAQVCTNDTFIYTCIKIKFVDFTGSGGQILDAS